MRKTGIDKLATAAVVAAMILAAAIGLADARKQEAASSLRPRGDHVPEVRALLSNLEVDEPRTHKNMIVFPIRWSGRQAPGRWETLDEAVAAGRPPISGKGQARGPPGWMAHNGRNAGFLMSGGDVQGGRKAPVV